MRRAAIVMPMRTPVGLPGGALGAVAPHRLIATALSAVLGRSGIDPERIEHLVTAVPTPEPARLAADLAGIPPAIGHFPIGAGPGSGLRALITAAMMVQTGTADVVLAVGAEYSRTGPTPFTGGSATGPLPRVPGTTSSGPVRGASGRAVSGPVSGVSGDPASGPLPRTSGATSSRPMPGVPGDMASGPLPGVSGDTASGPLPRVSGAAAYGSFPGLSGDTASGPLSRVPGAPPSGPLSRVPGDATSGPSPRVPGDSASGPLPRVPSALETGPSAVPGVAGVPPSGRGGPDPRQPSAYPAGSTGPHYGGGESGSPPAGFARYGGGDGAGPAAARAEGAARAALERVEHLAAHYGFSRVQADEVAAVSHRRAAKARRQGVFGAETAPVVVCADPDDMNSDVVQLMDRDEGLRDDVSPRAFSTLLPLLPGGVVTTANSSARTFAAAACLVVAEERLADLDLEPLGYLVGWVNTAVDPAVPRPASAEAVAKVLSSNGFELGDLDLVEVDESDAIEILALEHLWGDWDPEDTRLNVHGGAIALGDPGGAAGLRMVTTLLHELTRRQGGRGLAVTASGTSQSLAVLFESPYSRPITPTPRGARFHGSRSRRSGRHRA
ncbi:hypothetical protein [Nocardia sp. CC227C]|uniref:thiolase family protein n=1 Tax=Nocardia sp. CC227C TaxID=3044562 RepID=UPI00278C7143|nr:hypothetical protein [Nocardia sp. CC227C]